MSAETPNIEPHFQAADIIGRVARLAPEPTGALRTSMQISLRILRRADEGIGSFDRLVIGASLRAAAAALASSDRAGVRAILGDELVGELHRLLESRYGIQSLNAANIGAGLDEALTSRPLN